MIACLSEPEPPEQLGLANFNPGSIAAASCIVRVFTAAATSDQDLLEQA